MGARCGAVLLLLLGFVPAPSGTGLARAAGPEQAESEHANGHVGLNLHRVAATIDLTLDVYRLALLELVPAAQHLLEVADRPSTYEQSEVPAVVKEVYARLARSMRRRVPREQLSPLLLAYHNEVDDGLQRLAAADTLGQLVEPHQQLQAGLLGMLDLGEHVLTLFSRRRPLMVAITDPSTVLDDLNEAIDQLSAAEQVIARMRAQKRRLKAQLAAFTRLEVALGHVLDLVSAAQEAGLQLGFVGPFATDRLAERHERVREQAGTLVVLVTKMTQAPPPVTSENEFAGLWRDGGAGSLAVGGAGGEGVSSRARRRGAEFSWRDHALDVGRGGVWLGLLAASSQLNASASSSRVARWRVYRHSDLAAARRQLAWQYACDRPAKAALSAAAADLSDLEENTQVIMELSREHLRFFEPWDDEPVVVPRYTLVAVSPFGVESTGDTQQLRYVPKVFEGAHLVRAGLVRPVPEPEDETFYATHDQVTVSWDLSRNDVVTLPWGRRVVRTYDLPWVVRYRIERVHEGQRAKKNDGKEGGESSAKSDGLGKATSTETQHVEVIAHVAAGTRTFEDRPPLASLAAGLRYRVIAETKQSNDSNAPSPECVTSSRVRRDMRSALVQAQAGASWLVHPTAYAYAAAKEYESRERFQVAASAFEQQGRGTQVRQRRRWWQGVAVQQRRAWLDVWPTYVVEGSRSAWLSQGATQLSHRDLRLAQAEIWLSEHPAFASEVDRWWGLLDTPTRTAAVVAWRSSLNSDHLRWIDGRTQGAGKPAVRSENGASGGSSAVTKRTQRAWLSPSYRPARVLAWWESRDPFEQQDIASWWAGKDEAQQRSALQGWFDALPEHLREAVRWPQWRTLTQEEQERRLTSAYRELPRGLENHFLAWLAWEALPLERKVAHIKHEVGTIRAALAKLRYALRPVDVLLGFHFLRALLGFVCGMVLVGAALRWLSPRVPTRK